jgi:predicted dehydrogenase
MQRLRVGVIGCGGIAQMMHLPYLRELDDRFELVALADIDATTLERVADHYGVARRHTTTAGMLAEPIDAVFILTSGDHTADVLAALDSGRHVFAEKPLAYTLGQTDEITEAARLHDRIVMVGMMKQYDPGYRRGVEAVQALRDLRYVEARTLQADDGAYRTHHPILTGDSAPRPERPRLYGAAADEAAQRGILGSQPLDLLREATGSTRPEVLTAFFLLLVSSIHDVCALRGAIGRPAGVVSAHLWAGGTSFTTVLAYDRGFRATYSWTSVPYLKHYGEDFFFFGSEGRVAIRFPSPYLRNEPTLVELETMAGEELHRSSVVASYEEAFKLELIHFHECVVERRQPLTDVPGFRADLELLIEIARAF